MTVTAVTQNTTTGSLSYKITGTIDYERLTVRGYVVSTLSQEDMETVAGEYENYSANGSIGDSVLRRTAETYLREFTFYTGGVTGAMKEIAFECFRELTWRFLEPDE